MNNNVKDKPLGGSNFIRRMSKRLSRRRKKKAAVEKQANETEGESVLQLQCFQIPVLYIKFKLMLACKWYKDEGLWVTLDFALRNLG